MIYIHLKDNTELISLNVNPLSVSVFNALTGLVWSVHYNGICKLMRVNDHSFLCTLHKLSTKIVYSHFGFGCDKIGIYMLEECA